MKVYAHKNLEMYRVIKNCIETENYQYGAIDLQDVCNYIIEECAYNYFDVFDVFDEDGAFIVDCIVITNEDFDKQIMDAVGKECEVHEVHCDV